MLLTTEYCYICKKQTNHFNGDCGICSVNKEKNERDKHFKKLDELSLEQRIRLLEESLYNHFKDHPVYDRIIN